MRKANPEKSAIDETLNVSRTDSWVVGEISQSAETELIDIVKFGPIAKNRYVQNHSIWVDVLNKIISAVVADAESLDPPISGYFPTVPNRHRGGH